MIYYGIIKFNSDRTHYLLRKFQIKMSYNLYYVK